MKHQRRKRSLSIVLSTCLATLSISACSESAANNDDPTAALRQEMRQAGALLMDELKPLFDTPEGKQALATIASEHPNLYFDGDARFAQTSTATSLASASPTFSVEMISNAPDGFARSIRFFGPTQPTNATVDFTPDTVVITATVNGNEQQFTAPWTPATLPPFGTIDIAAGTTDIKP